MQPYFFPYIGYWQLINAVDKFVIYDDVNYIKRGWINRNNILVNGEEKLINLRIRRASQNKLINELEVVNDGIYNNYQLKVIKASYCHAPFFNNVFPLVERVIRQKEDNLSTYLENSIKEVCKYLSIDTEIIISSEISKSNELKGKDKIIEICKQLSADQYLNAIGGQFLYSSPDFQLCGIELKFLKTLDITYPQTNKEKFVPNLSILDIMMFNSPEQIKSMLEDYELI